jgi:hypothetical protein
VNYNRALVLECSSANFLSHAHTLILVGETRKGVRFLMRWSTCILKLRRFLSSKNFLPPKTQVHKVKIAKEVSFIFDERLYAQ